MDADKSYNDSIAPKSHQKKVSNNVGNEDCVSSKRSRYTMNSYEDDKKVGLNAISATSNSPLKFSSTVADPNLSNHVSSSEKLVEIVPTPRAQSDDGQKQLRLANLYQTFDEKSDKLNNAQKTVSLKNSESDKLGDKKSYKKKPPASPIEVEFVFEFTPGSEETVLSNIAALCQMGGELIDDSCEIETVDEA